VKDSEQRALYIQYVCVCVCVCVCRRHEALMLRRINENRNLRQNHDNKFSGTTIKFNYFETKIIKLRKSCRCA
jgi:hypothetical protein